MKKAAVEMSFVRALIATAMAKGNPESALNIARLRWGERSIPAQIIERGLDDVVTKATVPGGTRLSGSWAEFLASPEGAAAEFFAAVRERSLLGRIEGLRRVPLNTRLLSAGDGFEAAWIAEGAAIPVSSASFSEDSLNPLKCAALTVISRDLLESSDPAAEGAIRTDLLNACVAAIDATFTDPTNAGSAGVKPASVTYGAPSIAASGDGLADLRELIAGFPGDLERAVLIGSPATFAVLSDPLLMPLLGVRGGFALGIPAIPSKAAGTTLALIDPDGIAVGEGPAEVSTTNEGTIQMSDAPTNNSATPTPTTLVSMWQSNATAIKALMVLNFKVARPSVMVITGEAPS